MYRIIFELDSFNGSESPLVLKEVVDELCLALAEANAQWLISNPGAPLLYESGVYYKEEKSGREEFFDIPRVLRQGYADCEDLCAWRAAELWVRFGVPAECRVNYQLDGDRVMFHVQVHTYNELGRGVIEDPSVNLGMRV